MTNSTKKHPCRPLLLLQLSVGLFIGLPTNGHAQVTPHQDTTGVFANFTTPATYPGGIHELKKYLIANVKYPAAAESAKIRGRVFMSFTIETDGQLTDISVLKGLGYGCDEEALRVIKAMPHWTPGRQSGELVRVRYNLPVLFGIAYAKRKGVL